MPKKIICHALIASMFAFSVHSAGAGMIGADQAVPAATAERTLVLNVLDRAETTAQLQAQGIDPAAARDRVAAMSDQEVQQLAADMQTAPAGADVSVGGVLLVAAIAAAVWYFVFRR